MRYKVTNYGPSNKRQYTLSVGKRDIEILLGLVVGASQNKVALDNTTQNQSYLEIHNRLKSMRSALREALSEAEKLGDDNERRKVHRARGEKP